MYSFDPPEGLPEYEFPIFPDFKNYPSVIIETIGFLTEGPHNFYVSYLIDMHHRIVVKYAIRIDERNNLCTGQYEFDFEWEQPQSDMAKTCRELYHKLGFEDQRISLDDACPVNMIKEMRRNFFCAIYSRIWLPHQKWFLKTLPPFLKSDFDGY
jgi:hypothetical protein